MLNKKITIAIEEGGPNEAFGVTFPDIEGCFSAGDTLEEAIENAQEAVEGYLELCLGDGDELPNFLTIQEHRTNPEYEGFIWSFVNVDITPYMGKSKKVNVTLPGLLIEQIDKATSTRQYYKSRSDFLAKAAINELKTYA